MAPAPVDTPVAVQDASKCAAVCADAQNACPGSAKPVGTCVDACANAAPELETPLPDLAVALTCS